MSDPFPPDDKWSPGVYFNLPEDRYHRSPWLGSSSIKTLASCPPDYWYASAMNPLRVEDDEDATPAKTFGTAVHFCVLYGRLRFEERYSTVPGDRGKVQISADGLKLWIESQGGKPEKLADDNRRLILDEYETILLPEKQFQRILVAATTIRSNPNLEVAFQGGWPEVSIFWRENGIACKCRIDYLKLVSSVDLKSMRGGDRYLTFDGMVIADIKKYKYAVQGHHYTMGRLAARDLVKEGRVFAAGDRPDDRWLKACFGYKTPSFTFVFFKSDGAPVAKSYEMPFGGDWLTEGASYRESAMRNYERYWGRFGSDIWVAEDEPYVLDGEDLRHRVE